MRVFSSLSLAGLLLLPLAGCDSRGDIKVYLVPKETAPAPVPAADPHAGVPMPAPGSPDPHAGLAGGGATGTARPPGVAGEVPGSWKPGRGSSMRLASYLVEGENRAVADISLIVLGGGAGGVLDNVNRWRGQLGLDPVDEAGLAESSRKVATPQGEAVVADLVAATPAADPARDGRIIAGILPLAGEVWFYKMRGNPQLVGREKEAFLRWMASARKVDPAPAADTAAPAATPREITWQVPDGWKEMPGKSMRIATFAVSGDDGASGEATVIKLGGNGGGDLANVNRWREQVGLDPITAGELAASVTTLDSPGGAITTVDCAGPAKSTLAGWLARDGSTWFFKLTGPPALVDAERARFTSFLSSVSFPAK